MSDSVSLERKNTEMASSLLHQTRRALDPLQSLSFYARFVLPGDDPAIRSYVDNLNKAVSQLQQPRQSSVRSSSDANLVQDLRPMLSASDLLSGSEAFEVPRGSKLYPPLGDPLAQAIRSLTNGLAIEFRKKSAESAGDTRLLIPLEKAETTLVYEATERKLVLDFRVENSKSEDWWNDGEYLSVADLQESSVIFRTGRAPAAPNASGKWITDEKVDALIRGSWLYDLQLSTARGVDFTSYLPQRIRSANNDQNSFGGEFGNLFEPRKGLLSFDRQSGWRYSIEPDFQNQLESSVASLLGRLSQYGFKLSGDPIRVSVNPKDVHADQQIHRVVLPADHSSISGFLVVAVASYAIDHDSEVSDELAQYFTGDFLNSPHFALAEKTDNLSLDDADCSVACVLWDVRQTLGQSQANGLLSAAIRKWHSDYKSYDTNEQFGALLEAVASGPAAKKIHDDLKQVGLRK